MVVANGFHQNGGHTAKISAQGICEDLIPRQRRLFGCYPKLGKALANAMDTHAFRDWERVVVALDNERICGYCTVAETDCIPNVPYTPYIGFMFVDEMYRGHPDIF